MGCSFPHTTRVKVYILVEDTINLRDRGVSDINLVKKGDVIIDTLIGIGSTILKHKYLIGSTASAVGNVVGAIYKEYKRCPKGIS